MSENNQSNPNWERQTIEKLAFSAIAEQKRARRWGIFFKSLTFVYLFFLLFYAMDWVGGGSKSGLDHTALIDIQGVIGSSNEVNADSVLSSLEDAYENKHTKGIILRINSPGGSPV